MSCQPNIPIFARFLNSSAPLPLTPRQKFTLAARNVSDPFSLLTIGWVSAYSVATDSHNADGPGFRGFAKNAGVSLSQDMTGEFFSTFLIPSLARPGSALPSHAQSIPAAGASFMSSMKW